MPAPSSWRRLDGIDLLRGLAIFFVLMNHVNMQLLFAHVPYTRGLPRQLVSTLVWNGQYGVQIFFAISGFLITSTSLRRWRSLPEVWPREFYLLRLARIAPLLLLLLAILSVLHLAHVEHFRISAKVATLPQALFAALTFRSNVLEATHGYLPGNWDILWSLSVEEMFYLFFPPACLLLRRTWIFVLALCIFVALGPYARTVLTHGNEVWYEYSYLGATDAIALGCLTAIISAHKQLSRNTLRTTTIAGAALTIFILCFSRSAAVQATQRLGLDMTILALGTCLLLITAAQRQARNPRALIPLLEFGRRSYEIYLTHMFVVIAAAAIFLRFGKPLRGVPFLFLGVIVAAGILGELVARFYTEPMNRVIRRRFRTAN